MQKKRAAVSSNYKLHITTRVFTGITGPLAPVAEEESKGTASLLGGNLVWILVTFLSDASAVRRVTHQLVIAAVCKKSQDLGVMCKDGLRVDVTSKWKDPHEEGWDSRPDLGSSPCRQLGGGPGAQGRDGSALATSLAIPCSLSLCYFILLFIISDVLYLFSLSLSLDVISTGL